MAAWNWWLAIGAAVVIAVGHGWLLLAAIKLRGDGPRDLPGGIRVRPAVEIAWTAVTIIGVAGLLWFVFRALAETVTL